MKPRIAITLGDPAGIGPEIVTKALRHPRVSACCNPIVVAGPSKRRIPLGRPSRDAGRSAILALQRGVELVQKGEAAALVTAPVSKESFHYAQLRFPGHTEWLADKTGAHEVAMLMVAGPLHALLMTRHIPLRRVSDALSPAVISSSARLGYEFVRNLLGKKHPRLVACGVNPHAGDGGLLGNEEQKRMSPALQKIRRAGIHVAGPFPADSVFRDMSRGLYDLALAAYHDQGMIPLKLFAPDRLVNVTLGLPFIRTSPGHGTAYDIAGKNRADTGPMIEAICLAAQYCQAR